MKVDEGYLILAVASSNFTDTWIKVNFITSLLSSHQENHPFTHLAAYRGKELGDLSDVSLAYIFAVPMENP